MDENTPKQRVEEMCQAHEVVREHVKSWLSLHGVDFTDESVAYSFFYRRLCSFNEQQLVKPSVRTYFIAKCYQYLKACTFREVLDAPEWLHLATVGEFCITLMYLKNHAQDFKYGINAYGSPESKQNQAAQKEIHARLIEYIDLHFPFLNKEAVHSLQKRLFAYYGLGMEIDEDGLSHENYAGNNGFRYPELHNPDIVAIVSVQDFWQAIMSYRKIKYGAPPKNGDYLKLYLTRTYLMNAVFFQLFTEYLIDHFGQHLKLYPELIDFARYYGMCQQLVNDICDYVPEPDHVPTVAKLQEDTFSDMRRRLVTLPLILYFSNSSLNGRIDLLKHYCGISDLSSYLYQSELQEEVLRMLKKAKAIEHAMSLVCHFSQTFLLQDKLDSQNPATPLMSDMFSFVRNNQYYQFYNKLLL